MNPSFQSWLLMVTELILLSGSLAYQTPLFFPFEQRDEVPKHAIAKVSEFKNNLYEKIADLLKKAPLKTPSSFSWSSCGGPSDVITVKKLEVSPDPLPLQDNVFFTVHLVFSEDLDDPLKLDIHTQRKSFNSWQDVDCQGYWGTCMYENVCPMLARMPTCPPQFQRKLPCKCPFKKGVYEIDNSRMRTDLPSYASGEYKSTVKIFKENRQVGCFQTTYSVA